MKQHPKFKNLYLAQNGEVYNKDTGRYIKGFTNSNGYRLVFVSNLGKSYRLHRLMAETYLPDCEFYGLDVNHKDGDKLNNHIDNLEWCTRSHNIRHAHDTGLNNCHGENHHSSVYTEEFIHEICKKMEEGYRNIDLVNEYKVDKDFLSHIRRGSLWVRVSSQYDISVKRNKRLSTDKVRQICAMLEEGKSVKEIVSAFQGNLHRVDVERIRRGQTFSEISKDFNINYKPRKRASV